MTSWLRLRLSSLLFLVVAAAFGSSIGMLSSQAFVFPPPQRHYSSTTSAMTTSTAGRRGRNNPAAVRLYATMNKEQQQKEDLNVDDMKRDIAKMREEAMKRLDALNEKLHEAEEERHVQKQDLENLLLSTTTVDQNTVDSKLSPSSTVVLSMDDDEQETVSVSSESASISEGEETDRLYQLRLIKEREGEKEAEESLSSSFSAATATTTIGRDSLSSSPSSPIKLLDNTRWRVMLNIGRESGTWMPKTWGISGERLYMHLELEFTPDQLYEREEFLNGVSGAKILHVIHSEGMLSPSMREGGRKVRVRDGGWRVAPGEGPMGTSVLRFYFELEEETRHQGCDVYLPAGRVYCTCGYFPMAERYKNNKGLTLKDSLRRELHDLEAAYEALATENELDTSLFSLEKMQRGKQMMDIRMQANKLKQKMNEAQVREPEKSLLRLSRDQNVGLTREGGVCCKVHKGLAIEYHILGKFEIASMENREHSDYRELLP